ncbi:hypothetical protein [Macrococcoides canis]|uniref:hypothetical protein n=1 Tax=Macrococcoides canis TaxID=1855823 RepID=UPI0020B648E1|nr:hypothetical protein [Macrococcus canis]UTG99944.1 hypothetical protein KFV04_10860 [Macrococcus canis]
MRKLEDYRALKKELAKWNSMTPTSYVGSIARTNKIKMLKRQLCNDQYDEADARNDEFLLRHEIKSLHIELARIERQLLDKYQELNSIS